MIKNSRNGKKYIGSTKNAAIRRTAHFYKLKNNKHPCDKLQMAYNKEKDKSVFEYHMFIYCEEKDLITLEQGCFDQMKPEYNMSLIAGRPEHTPSVRKKMSDAKKGKPSPKKGKPSGKPAWNKGKSPSKETCAKISLKNTGNPAWNKGIEMAEDTKNLVRIAAINMWDDPDYRQKQKKSHSVHTKSLWENDEYRDSHTKRTTNLWQDPKFIWVQMLNAWHRKNVYWQRYYGA